MEKGKLIIFSAPSGSGKTTIVRFLQDRIPSLSFSISATTRDRRPHELDGKDYYFLSEEDFRTKIEEGAFIEWEEVYESNFYGTLRSEVERLWAEGKHVIFDIDVMGGLRLKKYCPDNSLAVFVRPPSLEELERRLRDRKTESEEKIQMRMNKAAKEMAFAAQFDTILENAVLEVAKEEALQLVTEFLDQ